MKFYKDLVTSFISYFLLSGQDPNILFINQLGSAEEIYLGLVVKTNQSISLTHNDLPFKLTNQLPCSISGLVNNCSQSDQSILQTNISVRLGTFSAGCVYFNTATEKWTSEGCYVWPT